MKKDLTREMRKTAAPDPGGLGSVKAKQSSGGLARAARPTPGTSELSQAKPAPDDLGASRPSGQARNFGNHMVPSGGYDGPDNLRDVGVAIRRGVAGAIDYGTRPLRAGAGAYYGGLRDLATGIITDKTKAEAAKGEGLAAVKASPATEPNEPHGDDSLASVFVDKNSQAANSELNAGKRKVVPGLDGVSYAGKYGKTDVFAGTTYDENGDKVTNFSDLANLATTRGGAAAPVPEGKTAVTNTSPAALYAQADVNKDGLPDQTSPELVKARQAAIERGDLASVERSYMTSEQRAVQDAQRKRDDLRDAVIQRDPVAAYAVDQDSLAAEGRLAYQKNQDSLQLLRDQQSAIREDEKTELERNKAIAKIMADLEMAGKFPEKATLMQKREIAEQVFRGNPGVLEGKGGSESEAAKTINALSV